MRRLILVAGLSLAILTGSVGEVAAANDDSYRCNAVGPGGHIHKDEKNLTQEQAQAFKEQYKAEGYKVKCTKKF